jgi:hypothetical protein
MLTQFPNAVAKIPVSNVEKTPENYVNALGFHFDWSNDQVGGISEPKQLFESTYFIGDQECYLLSFRAVISSKLPLA